MRIQFPVRNHDIMEVRNIWRKLMDALIDAQNRQVYPQSKEITFANVKLLIFRLGLKELKTRQPHNHNCLLEFLALCKENGVEV